ncbi:MAG: flagellar brake protein [Bacillota bacterium]
MKQLEKVLALNRKIEVRIDGQEDFYKSSVQGLNPQGFVINVPMLRGDWLRLTPGMQVQVKSITDEAQYLFTSTVLSRLMEKDLPLYLLSLPGDIERLQLRDYVRVRCALEVFYREVPLSELPNVPLLVPDKKGITLDLSGGGLRMVIKEPINPDNLILLKIILPTPRGKPKIIMAIGEVRGYESTYDDQPRYEVRLSFQTINERDRDKIIARVFHLMIEAAKKLD